MSSTPVPPLAPMTSVMSSAATSLTTPTSSAGPTISIVSDPQQQQQQLQQQQLQQQHHLGAQAYFLNAAAAAAAAAGYGPMPMQQYTIVDDSGMRLQLNSLPGGEAPFFSSGGGYQTTIPMSLAMNMNMNMGMNNGATILRHPTMASRPELSFTLPMPTHVQGMSTMTALTPPRMHDMSAFVAAPSSMVMSGSVMPAPIGPMMPLRVLSPHSKPLSHLNTGGGGGGGSSSDDSPPVAKKKSRSRDRDTLPALRHVNGKSKRKAKKRKNVSEHEERDDDIDEEEEEEDFGEEDEEEEEGEYEMDDAPLVPPKAGAKGRKDADASAGAGATGGSGTGAGGRRRKRRIQRREPLREDFGSEEAFAAAWMRWRHVRDSNNKAVKKSRNKRRVELGKKPRTRSGVPPPFSSTTALSVLDPAPAAAAAPLGMPTPSSSTIVSVAIASLNADTAAASTVPANNTSSSTSTPSAFTPIPPSSTPPMPAAILNAATASSAAAVILNLMLGGASASPASSMSTGSREADSGMETGSAGGNTSSVEAGAHLAPHQQSVRGENTGSDAARVTEKAVERIGGLFASLTAPPPGTELHAEIAELRALVRILAFALKGKEQLTSKDELRVIHALERAH